VGGILFLFINSLVSIGIVLFGVGLLLLYSAKKDASKPLISVSDKGILFDIDISGKGIFVPWDGIVKVGAETISSPGVYRVYIWIPATEKMQSLVFEIHNNYLGNLPKVIKGAYYKRGAKLYFAEPHLSIAVEDAVQKINSIKNEFKGLS